MRMSFTTMIRMRRILQLLIASKANLKSGVPRRQPSNQK
jgi:hypothetical protein